MTAVTPFFPAYVNSRQEDRKDEHEDSAQVPQVKYDETIIVLEFIA